MVRSVARFVGIALNPLIDHTGTHQANVAQIKRFLELEGYMVHVYPIKTEADLSRMIRGIQSNNYDFMHCEQGHFLGLQLDGKPLFDQLSLPVFSQLRDHWFYPWVWRNLKTLPDTAHIFHTSELHKTMGYQLAGKHYHVPHTSQLARQIVDLSDSRPAPIFYSGSCRSIQAVTETAQSVLDRSMIERVMDETVDSVQMPSWVWSVKVVNHRSVTVDEINMSLDAYNKLFDLARTRIRANILEVASYFDVQMFVKGGWKPPSDARCRFSNQSLPFLQSNFLASTAKYILSDQATFREELGERAVTALDSNQNLIARGNMWLTEHQVSNKDSGLLLYNTLSELHDMLSIASEDGPGKREPEQLASLSFSIQSYVRGMTDTVSNGIL